MLPELLNEQLRLVDGTIVKKCPTIKPLYCSKDGRFFSVRNMQITDEGCIMHELKPCFNPGKKNLKGGSAYPAMTNFGNRLCHHLIYETWMGERKPGMQIDHVNGDPLDYRACNLEQVTPSENMRRAKYLRVMRQCEFDPRIFTANDLRQLFAMPFDEFKTMILHHSLAD